MAGPKILAFAGSLRTGSFNKLLVKVAAAGARAAGAEVTIVDLRDFPMPIFDEDLEAREGMPETAQRLKRLFLDHQGLLLAAPEYNSSITAVLKNTLDWVSRKGPGDLATWAFSGKVVGLMSASPGALGGLRGLVHVRSILNNIDAHVIPSQVAIMQAHEAFDGNGNLKDPKQQRGVEQLAAAVVTMVKKLNA